MAGQRTARRAHRRMNCSIARALDLLGDGWSLLVIREAFFGTRRFADFQENLPIAKNVLSERLKGLTRAGVLTRVDVGVHGRRHEYLLTPMGRDLITVITALRQWGDRWIFGAGREPLLVRDRRTGEAIPKLRLRDASGKLYAGTDLLVEAGPGATTATKTRAKRLRSTLPPHRA